MTQVSLPRLPSVARITTAGLCPEISAVERPMRRILLLHVCLLVLAVTRFTIVTSAFLGGFPRWSFVTFVSQNGFGYKYASPFSLPVVLTYIAAYTVGLVGFTLALKRGSSIVGTLGAALSVLG